MGEWAPPFGTLSNATPPPLSGKAQRQGGADENHSQLGVVVMRIIRIQTYHRAQGKGQQQGPTHFSPIRKGKGKRKHSAKPCKYWVSGVLQGYAINA